MWLRPKARKAGRRQGDRALRKTTATAFVVEQSSPPRPALNDTPNLPLLTFIPNNQTGIPGRERIGDWRPLILTWRALRRRLEVWPTHTEFTFGLILGRMRKRPSRRVTNWKAGGKLSVWTSASNTKWTAPEMQCQRLRRKRRPLKSLLKRPRAKKSLLRRALNQRENPASLRLQGLPQQNPMATLTAK